MLAPVTHLSTSELGSFLVPRILNHNRWRFHHRGNSLGYLLNKGLFHNRLIQNTTLLSNTRNTYGENTQSYTYKQTKKTHILVLHRHKIKNPKDTVTCFVTEDADIGRRETPTYVYKYYIRSIRKPFT